MNSTQDAPAVSVVEELLNKGARFLADYDEMMLSEISEQERQSYLDAAGIMLDAVLPGWREGISREWGWRDSEGNCVPSGADRRATTGLLRRGETLVSALVVRSWLPVEDGTEGGGA